MMRWPIGELMTQCADAPDAQTRKAKACLPFFDDGIFHVQM